MDATSGIAPAGMRAVVRTDPEPSPRDATIPPAAGVAGVAFCGMTPPAGEPMFRELLDGIEKPGLPSICAKALGPDGRCGIVAASGMSAKGDPPPPNAPMPL